MLAKVASYGLAGMEAYPIEIEIDVSSGLPCVTVVGMADTAIKESRERVKSALKNSGFKWPASRITVSLAPSDLKKEGSSFDLAIALGVLAASGQINAERLAGNCVLGELALDGTLRPVRGILPISLAIGHSKSANLIIPAYNLPEACLNPDIKAFGLKNLRQTVAFLGDPAVYAPGVSGTTAWKTQKRSYNVDFSEVKGQKIAKRALEIAVSGGHNLLMIGPPGGGKTMLAKRTPTIMPELSPAEALEITKIHSIAGNLSCGEGLAGIRPFRAPHHGISSAGLIGGGNAIPTPGEISLAHLGVLFLDELPEFHRDCLEALRQPLEEGSIRVCRSEKAYKFPASFMLIAAMNPCPCGYYTDPRRPCRCSPARVAGYISKISGPLLDRIDLHISLPPVKYGELVSREDAESSETIRARVQKTRLAQAERLRNEGIFYNAAMDAGQIRRYCVPDDAGRELLRLAMTELGLSARAYDKVLKVSRTIADMDGTEQIRQEHIAEAIQYRSLDRELT